MFLFLVEHYDSSSGSLQLISIKPMAVPPTYSHPASSDRSQDSAVFNGEVKLDFIRDSFRWKPLTKVILLTFWCILHAKNGTDGCEIATSMLIVWLLCNFCKSGCTGFIRFYTARIQSYVYILPGCLDAFARRMN